MSQFFLELAWNDINWQNSYNIVQRSQRRIFKASQLGDKRKVIYLQQSLIRSPYAKVISVQKIIKLNTDKNNLGIDDFLKFHGFPVNLIRID